MTDEDDNDGSGGNKDSGRNDERLRNTKKKILSNVQSMFGELSKVG